MADNSLQDRRGFREPAPSSHAPHAAEEDRFEAVVVGAGPAGTMAARHLGSLGHRVLLVERDRIPRYKACGGGLSPKAVARLPFPIAALPHVRLQRIAFRLRGGSPIVWDLSADFPFYMVMRAELDQRLAEAAVAAGATLEAPETVCGLHAAGEEAVVETDRGCYRTRFVIGADGATSRVRRLAGIGRRPQLGVALESEIEVAQSRFEQYKATALFDVDAVPDGYGWIFPKQTHLSVGIGTMKPDGRHLRELLQDFVLRHGLLAPEALSTLTIHVHPLPMATPGEPARSGPVLLAGDAAGVADGFGGEGICYAMASGELAGRTVARALGGDSGALIAYEAELDRLIRRDHQYAHLMGRIARKYPRAAYTILTSIGVGRPVLIPLLLGELSFGESLRRLPGLLALHHSGQANQAS